MESLINTFEEKTNKFNDCVLSADFHFHNGYEFIFVVNGEVEMKIGDTPYKVKSPAIIMLNPFEQHKITGESANYERKVLVLNADVLEHNISPHLTAMLKLRPQGFSHSVLLSEEDYMKIDTIFKDLGQEVKNDNLFSKQYILNSIYNMLIVMFRIQKINWNFSSRMINVQVFIDENYDKIDTVKDIADRFCVSVPHLSRSFKAYSGYSPVEYLKNTRLYHAQHLLIYSDLRVNEIGREVGFKETNNFIKQFKNVFGISPQNFRKKDNKDNF